MKKAFIVIGLLCGLVFVAYLLYSAQDVDSGGGEERVAAEINELTDKYGHRAYRAFYSIEELRPFCIIRNDKTAELYDNKWISPSKLVNLLDSEDKTSLKTDVIDYLGSLEDDKRVNRIISKLFNWCKVDIQFNYIESEMEVYKINLLKALRDADNEFFKENFKYERKGSAVEKMSEKQIEEIYYRALNAISSLNKKEILKYYGGVFDKLSLICAKD